MMVVVGGLWWLWVGHGGCVGVMVCESWWLCVCESKEVSKDAIICQVPTTSDIQG